MELYLGVFFGVLLYVLFSLNEAYTMPGFEWKIYIRQNWLVTLTNLAAGFVLVWRKDDLATFLPMTPLIALYLGVGGQTLLKRIFKMFDKKVDTVIGV
jgi:hypothetical protein